MSLILFDRVTEHVCGAANLYSTPSACGLIYSNIKTFFFSRYYDNNNNNNSNSDNNIRFTYPYNGGYSTTFILI